MTTAPARTKPARTAIARVSVRDALSTRRGQDFLDVRALVIIGLVPFVVPVSAQDDRAGWLSGARWQEWFGRYVGARYRGPEVRVVGPVNA